MHSRKPKKSEKKSPVRAATREKLSKYEIDKMCENYHRTHQHPHTPFCCSGWDRNKPVWLKALTLWLNRNDGAFPGDKWMYCPWCGKSRRDAERSIDHG